jgi:hypothetical protein
VDSGHDVTVLKTEYGKEHNFAIRDLPAKRYLGYIRNIKSYDFAVYENVLDLDLLEKLQNAGVYCISMYFHAFPNEYVMGSGYLYGNLTFCLGANFKVAQKNNGVLQEILPTGSPQYDDIDIKVGVNERVLLFLEQHFYPAGDNGKTQLATTLIETAKENPNYKIIVKPRSLPEFHNQSKHSSRHIYTYIENECAGKLPENLILLRVHQALLPLIEQSSMVATTFSTAIYPCLIARKPVIWVAGFDSEDIHYYNNNVIDSYYSLYKLTGRVLHFSKLSRSLNSAKPVESNLAEEIIYKVDRNAGARIVEILEYIYSNVISKGILLPYLDLDYENYKEKIDAYISAGSIEDNNTIRCLSKLNRLFNVCLDQFYRLYMSAGYLDGEILTELHRELKEIREKQISLLASGQHDLKDYENACSNCTVEYIKKYAQALQQSGQLSDDFKSTYVRWLYNQHSYNEFIAIGESFRCKDYDLYKALLSYKQRLLGANVLIRLLEKYRCEIINEEFPKTLFYTKTTLNEIDRYLILLYAKRLNIFRVVLLVTEYWRSNKREVVKKIVTYLGPGR